MESNVAPRQVPSASASTTMIKDHPAPCRCHQMHRTMTHDAHLHACQDRVLAGVFRSVCPGRQVPHLHCYGLLAINVRVCSRLSAMARASRRGRSRPAFRLPPCSGWAPLAVPLACSGHMQSFMRCPAERVEKAERAHYRNRPAFIARVDMR